LLAFISVPILKHVRFRAFRPLNVEEFGKIGCSWAAFAHRGLRFKHTVPRCCRFMLIQERSGPDWIEPSRKGVTRAEVLLARLGWSLKV
jgi:hypothetical protein